MIVLSSSNPLLPQLLQDAATCGFRVVLIWSDYDEAFLASCGISAR